MSKKALQDELKRLGFPYQNLTVNEMKQVLKIYNDLKEIEGGQIKFSTLLKALPDIIFNKVQPFVRKTFLPIAAEIMPEIKAVKPIIDVMGHVIDPINEKLFGEMGRKAEAELHQQFLEGREKRQKKRATRKAKRKDKRIANRKYRRGGAKISPVCGPAPSKMKKAELISALEDYGVDASGLNVKELRFLLREQRKICNEAVMKGKRKVSKIVTKKKCGFRTPINKMTKKQLQYQLRKRKISTRGLDTVTKLRKRLREAEKMCVLPAKKAKAKVEDLADFLPLLEDFSARDEDFSDFLPLFNDLPEDIQEEILEEIAKDEAEAEPMDKKIKDGEATVKELIKYWEDRIQMYGVGLYGSGIGGTLLQIAKETRAEKMAWLKRALEVLKEETPGLRATINQVVERKPLPENIKEEMKFNMEQRIKSDIMKEVIDQEVYGLPALPPADPYQAPIPIAPPPPPLVDVEIPQSALFKAIQEGVQLKPAEERQLAKPMSQLSPMDALVEELRRGKQLKPASERVLAPKVENLTAREQLMRDIMARSQGNGFLGYQQSNYHIQPGRWRGGGGCASCQGYGCGCQFCGGSRYIDQFIKSISSPSIF
jgi:hypothetical protein